MKAQITKVALTIATLGLLSAVSSTAFAQDHCDRGERPDHASVERSFEFTETGAVMSVAGADDEAIADIQERAVDPEARDVRWAEDATVETEFTETGVQVTFSSTDPEVVARIQEHAADGPPERGGRRGLPEDVDVVSVDTADGIEITMTSDNPESVDAVIVRAIDGTSGRCGGPEWIALYVETDIEVLDDGVRITMSSFDPEYVEMLQSHEGGAPGDGGRGER